MIKRILVGLGAFLATSLTAALAFAQEGAAAGASRPGFEFVGLAVAIGIGLAAAAGATGQGRATAAAVEGIARNPNAADKVFVPMILGLAFIESLVLFTWVLMLLLQRSM